MNQLGIQNNQHPRGRCYSSMSYFQFEDYFGIAPVMPEPPNSRPLEDPLDIPYLALEIEANERYDKIMLNLPEYHYIIETIPEVDSSEACSNGIGNKNIDSQYYLPEAVSTSSRKNRPRSFSENSPFNSRFKILNFMIEVQNIEQYKGRKKTKMV